MSQPKEYDWSQTSPGTVSVWGGEHRRGLEGATQTPIFTSVTYGFEDLEAWTDVARGEKAGHIYTLRRARNSSQ